MRSKWIGGALTGALWIAGATVSHAALEICNDTENLQSVAIGFKGDTDWMSQGWWNIEPGDCATVVGGDLTRRYYYYFADSGVEPFEGQEFFFCVENEIFDIVGDIDCEGRGYETVSMREIDTGETARDFTLTLVDGGGKPTGGGKDESPGEGEVFGGGGGSGGAPDGTPITGVTQDTTIVPPDEQPINVSTADLVTEIPAGTHGKGFETNALFQGCELEAGREYCSFHAGDWKMRVFYRGPTPEALMYALEDLSVNMPVLLKGDMVETEGNVAAIVVRGVLPAPGQDTHSVLRATMQGDWIDEGDQRWEMTVLGSELYFRQDGAFSAHRFFRIAQECDGSDGEGPVLVQINSENNRRTCYVIDRADAGVLQITDIRRGRTTVYRRLR
ncbi:MAG: DUF1036 domain-containing protein [Pseudomonadota bacterium]